MRVCVSVHERRSDAFMIGSDRMGTETFYLKSTFMLTLAVGQYRLRFSRIQSPLS